MGGESGPSITLSAGIVVDESLLFGLAYKTASMAN